MFSVKFVVALIVMLITYFGLNFYILNHIFAILSTFLPLVFSFAVVDAMAFLALLLPVVFLPSSPLLRKLRVLGMIWMGMFVYFLMFFSISDFIGLFIADSNTEFTISVIGFVVAIGMSAYSFMHDRIITTRKYHVQLSDNEFGLRIALISDLHLGSVFSIKRLEGIVNEVNKLDADIVCIAGDVFDGDFNLISDTKYCSSLLAKIKSKYGVYACLGNHDAGKSYEQMLRFLKNSNITLLSEGYVVINNQYTLVGRLDKSPIGGYKNGHMRSSENEVMVKARRISLPIIIMDHTPPKRNENICYFGDELVLCGHTHKGQIWPFGFVTNILFENDYGYSKTTKNQPHMITSCGAGTWGMPMRSGCTREIVRIDID